MSSPHLIIDIGPASSRWSPSQRTQRDAADTHFHDYATGVGAADGDVEEDSGRHFLSRSAQSTNKRWEMNDCMRTAPNYGARLYKEQKKREPKHRRVVTLIVAHTP